MDAFLFLILMISFPSSPPRRFNPSPSPQLFRDPEAVLDRVIRFLGHDISLKKPKEAQVSDE